MIGVRLAVEQNLDVTPAKAQLLHTRPDLRRRASEVCIDEDISFWRDDEVAGKVLASHVVQVVGNSNGAIGAVNEGSTSARIDLGLQNKNRNKQERKARILFL